MQEESDEALLEEYNFLMTHAPRGLENVQKKVLEEIVETRQNLIRDQRISYSFLSCNEYISIGSLQLGQIKKIFNPKILQKSQLSPSVSQQTNLFLGYIYSNLGTLAKAVIKFHKHEKFSHLINISIPGLFSNFTSFECIEAAYVFYLHILSGASPDFAIPVLAPIFNSMICFRYIESIMSKFLPKFFSDKRSLRKMKQKVIVNFEKKLFSMINSYVNLLPMKLLTLIHLMGSMKWSVDNLLKLFIDGFFAKQAEIYIRASPYSIILPQFKVILNHIRSNEQYMTTLYNTITSFDTTVHIPSLYRPFGDKFVTCLMSVEDINVLWQCIMNLGGDLPYSVRELDLKMDKKQTPFFISFFPKQFNSSEEGFAPLIFENKPTKHPDNPTFEHMYQNIITSLAMHAQGEEVGVQIGYESAKKKSDDKEFIHFALQASVCDLRLHAYAFELLLWYRMHSSIINDWLSISLARSLIFKKAAIVTCPVQPVETVFVTYSDVFGSSKPVQIAFIRSVMPTITEALSVNKSSFDELNCSWRNLLNKKKEVIDTDLLVPLSTTAQTIYWDAVEMLNTSDSVPLENRFFVIFRAIIMLSKISLERKAMDSLYVNAITFAAPEMLLSSFLLLTAFVMRETDFVLTISENDLLVWTRFESIILKYVMSKDFPQLQMCVAHLQDTLYSFKK